MVQRLFNSKIALLGLFAFICISILTVYAVTAYTAGQGNLLMPLDDVYIHFQYARQIAIGNPYVYNTGESATSGATSLLYPFVLAIGYLFGFQDLWLGLWAMLIGTVALLASMWAVYQICISLQVEKWLSLLTAILFAVTGSIAWHFMSGMETGLVIASLLWILLFFIRKQLWGFVTVATILTVLRPDGGILAAGASILMFARLWLDTSRTKQAGQRFSFIFLLLPILALGIQPLINYLLTDTTIATGNQAKSILAMIPHDWGIIISAIIANFVRMWREIVTGYAPQEGWYLPILLAPLALLGIVQLLLKPNYRLVGLLVIGWAVALTGAVSTLDTAFWHFKRYQMPLMAILFPLATFAISQLLNRFPRFRYPILAYQVVVVPLFTLALFGQFVNYHSLNVSYVYQQPYSMALWLRNKTPEDSLIAVHDVGMMRYIGGRNTLDMVGLTTPEAAAYWRNGPGSVAEFLMKKQPDYIASYGYGHGYGLAFLADTDIYGEPLAEFKVEDWKRYANVALAADYQGIYEPFWTDPVGVRSTISSSDALPISIPSTLENWQLVQRIDVADLQSEATVDYQWGRENTAMFNTEVRQITWFGNNRDLHLIDAGRNIDQFEQFTLTGIDASQDLMLVTGIHVSEAGQIEVYVDDRLVDARLVPNLTGRIVELHTLIPQALVTETLTFRIVPSMLYTPYYHAVWIGKPIAYEDLPEIASFQEGAFSLAQISENITQNQYTVSLLWQMMGNAQGDYRRFVHIYDDTEKHPILQRDGYLKDDINFIIINPAPENWQRGTYPDDVSINVETLEAGTYRVAIGFYNPTTGERLIPTSDVYEVSSDGRLWVDEITIEESMSDDG